ncbi:hypothetical protein THRCLA_08620 [Thraustotheca clavata]|uniref:B box-type domain-containing protein n=1 Tax=Thraustotheca clavata TaxID=74557 RepID=A0A1V9Z3Z2_9STRA|nr:hypothetical protein THRCLA_08620 [Thraustotheca clavata]
MTPFISIQSPPPDEEYIVYCSKHDTQPIEKATKYCLECDDAACDWCHERDHKRTAFLKHIFIPIELCSLCSVQTATRSCNECKEGRAPFCDSCYPHYHKDKKHTFTPLVALCVECQVKVGCWKCHVCNDLFCKKCFSSFHRKGHRQQHTLERVAYLPIQAKELQDQRAREEQRIQQALLAEAHVQEQLQEIDKTKMELAAKMIQSAYRAMKERVAGKAYMKMVRQTNWIMQQRVKDDVVRKGMAYKFKKAIGVAQALASDTTEEAAVIAARKEAIKDALGLSTYDYTKGTIDSKLFGVNFFSGPPAWCIYDAPVVIARGEYKNCQARVVSTKSLIESGNILLFINDAHKSITLSIRDIRPFDEEQEAAGAFGRLGQTLTKATHKIQNSVLSKVEQKRFELKLLHHRTEFKDIEEYAWIQSRDQDTGIETWWNVVNNGKAATKPRSLAALDTMQSTAKEEIITQLKEAHERLMKILRKTDHGAVDRRASLDVVSASPDQLNQLHEALFYFDNLWSHPHVGTKVKDLTKDLSTNQLQLIVRLFARLKGNIPEDEWEDFVLKFCRLPQDDKYEFTERCQDMTIEEAIASMSNISQSEKNKNLRTKHQSTEDNNED